MPKQTWLWRVCPFPKVGYMNCSASMLSMPQKRVSKLSSYTMALSLLEPTILSA